MYELQCVACKTINEFLIGLSEMPKINASREVSLKSLGMKCKKCKKNEIQKINILPRENGIITTWYAGNAAR